MRGPMRFSNLLALPGGFAKKIEKCCRLQFRLVTNLIMLASRLHRNARLRCDDRAFKLFDTPSMFCVECRLHERSRLALLRRDSQFLPWIAHLKEPLLMLWKWELRQRTRKPLSKRITTRALRVEWLEPRLALVHAPLGHLGDGAGETLRIQLQQLAARARRRMFRATTFRTTTFRATTFPTTTFPTMMFPTTMIDRTTIMVLSQRRLRFQGATANHSRLLSSVKAIFRRRPKV